jgi:hypothetical protein
MSVPGTRCILALAGVALIGLGLVSCAKEPLNVDRNRPPRTFLVAAPVDTTVAALRYSYRIHLYWRGEDPDGYVAGFLYSWDDSTIGGFKFTTKTDSIFELSVNDSSQITGGTGTNPGTQRAHTFYIRAVDNLGKPDPFLTIFNRRLFQASTEPPVVFFTGEDIPKPREPGHEADIDTLCDGEPFKVCWYGRDPDGVVTRYRVDVGAYHSPLQSDSCIYFNSPSQPSSVALASGFYIMTVTAIDNANAVGRNSVAFVVNRDPETEWAEKDADGPIGHYIQVYSEGNLITPVPKIFHAGDTIPFRSIVWWSWNGEDSHNGCENNCLSGFSLALTNGNRDNGQPYVIGFLDTLSTSPLIRFTTNDPDKMIQAGYQYLVLDSLDAGIGIAARVVARDCSGRPDGTPATFTFNCNFYPTLDSLRVSAVMADPDNKGILEPCHLIEWFGHDPEDGYTKSARITLDETFVILKQNYETSVTVPDRTFRSILPGQITHTVRVRVQDRAGFYAKLPEGEKEVRFDLPTPSP